MAIYYNRETYEQIDIPQETIDMWENTNNPKKLMYSIVPLKPTETSIWQNGEWLEPIISVPVSITAWQIRRWLVTHGISMSQIDSAIEGISDPIQRELVRVDWEYAPYVERSHPMLVPLGQILGLSESDINTAFIEASIL